MIVGAAVATSKSIGIWRDAVPICSIPLEPDDLVSNLHFSPDGQKLVTLVQSIGMLAWGFETRVFETPSLQLVRKISGSGTNAAWSRDGKILAVPRNCSPEIDLWNVSDWSRVRTLTIQPMPLQKEPIFGRLFFDAHERLYALPFFEFTDKDVGGDGTHAEVWLRGRLFRAPLSELVQQSFISSDFEQDLFSVSAGGAADPVRIAICERDFVGDTPNVSSTTYRASIRVYRAPLAVERRADWEWEMDIPAANESHLCLTPDGSNLGVLDRVEGRFEILRLHDGMATSLVAMDGDPEKLGGVVGVCDSLCASMDNRYMACNLNGQILVFCVVDGRQVLRVDRGGAIGISPDGSRIAVYSRPHHQIDFYDIPK